MNVLITGGCGYVGTKLTEAMLARTGHSVTVLDTQWFGSCLTPNPRLTIRAMDLRQIDEVDLTPFDAVIHLANIANDPCVDLNPYSSWEVNVLASMRLNERAARQGERLGMASRGGTALGGAEQPRPAVLTVPSRRALIEASPLGP